MTTSFQKQNIPVMQQKNSSRFRVPLPDQSFLRYKEPEFLDQLPELE